MKTKFLATLIAIFLLLPSLSFAEKKQETASTKKAKTPTKEYYNGDHNMADLKSFDFERIFREADAYFNAAQKWKTLKCFPKTGFLCSKHECPKLKLNGNSVLLLDKEQEIVAICRNKICQYYTGEFSQTGVFINVKIKEMNGVIIRVLGNNRFKQVSLIGLDAYITNGECTVLE